MEGTDPFAAVYHPTIEYIVPTARAALACAEDGCIAARKLGYMSPKVAFAGLAWRKGDDDAPPNSKSAYKV